MFHFNRVGKYFGERWLFRNATFSVDGGKRIGLIGANGSGKSTLLRIAVGEVEADEGVLERSPGARVGYLPQQAQRNSDAKSGGEIQQAALFDLLRSNANVFLLDEPTNNLDEATIAWFESELIERGLPCLIVSHDRNFLDRIVDEIIELDPITAATTVYGGNYSFYEEKKQKDHDRLMRSYEVQQKKVAQLERDAAAIKQQALATELHTTNDYLRGRSKKVAAKAKARDTRLQKLISEENKIEKPRESQSIRLSLGRSELIGRLLLDVRDLEFESNGKSIVKSATFTLFGGERIVIGGENGSGKSTLLKLLMGELEATAGEVIRTRSARVAYLPQRLDYLPEKERLLDWFENQLQTDKAYAQTGAARRTFLHRFLFSGEDVLKPIGRLSSGEKMRLQLAVFMANEPDLLILDEPTNHLDLPSIKAVEQALVGFAGSVIAVTHDRTFAANLQPTCSFVMEDGRLVRV